MKYLNTISNAGLKKLCFYLLAIIFSMTLISCDGVDVVDGIGSGGGSGGSNGGGSTSATGSRPVLSVNPVIALEGETVTFEVRLSHAATEAISVNYRTTDSVSSSFISNKIQQLSDEDLHILSEKTASSSSDYTAKTGALVFLRGEVLKTVSIVLTDDSVDNEGIESFALRVSTSSTALSNSNNLEGVAYIVDKDIPTNREPRIYFPARVVATENQGSVRVPFVIYPVLTSAASLHYATTSVTTDNSVKPATVNSDYTSVGAGVKSLSSGQTSGKIVINLVDDRIYEGSAGEQFAVNIFSSSIQLDQEAGSSVDTVANSIVVPVNIRDDEEKPYLVIRPKTLVEADSTMVAATLELSWASEEDISVTYQTRNSTAIAGEDYSAVPSTVLNFPASGGTVAKNINIVLLSDNEQEENQSFFLNFSLPKNVDLRNTEGAVVSSLDKSIIIRDSSSASVVSLVSNQVRVNEAVVAQNIYLSLNKASASDQVIAYSLIGYGSSPTTPADYSAGSSVTISAGQTTVPIPIRFLVDADTVDEQVQLRLTGVTSGGATLGNLNTSVITISGSSQPSVSVVVNSRDVIVAENVSGGFTNIGVSLSEATSVAVTVYYQIIAGTVSSADYSGATSGSVSIAQGATSANIRLGIINDTKHEANETLQVIIINVEGAVRDSINFISTVTITNDDSPAQVQFAGAASQRAESGSIHSIPLSLPESGKDITLNYTLTGTATNNVDYIDLGRGSVIIPAGQVSARINLQLIEDSTYEPNETIIVTLSGPSANLGVLKSHTVTIEESTVRPQIAFESSLTTVVESEGTLNIPVVLNRASSRAITATYVISTAGLTPAAQSEDYKPSTSPLSVSIPAGETRGLISIGIVGDGLSELNEKFKVTLSSPVGAELGTNTNIIATIYDDDGVPSVSLSKATYTVVEGDLLAVALNLTGVTSRAISLRYAVVAAATKPASSADYVAPSGVINIPAGSSSAIINLQTTEDTLYEDSEKLTIRLTSVDHGTLGGQTTAEIIITDDDTSPSVSFSATDIRVIEGSPARIPVSLSTASGKVVTVNYTLTAGTATLTTDYRDASTSLGSITVPAGATSGNIIINTTDDAVNEADETFTVALSSSQGGATRGTPNTKLVTIQDNDAVPVVSVESPSKTCTEGNSGNTACNIPIRLSAASAQLVTVTYTLASGTATLATDYADTGSGSVTIAAGQTTANIIINVVGDIVEELNETFTVTLGSATDASVHTSNRVTTATISNDDTATVSVASPLQSCGEGDSGNIVCNIPINLSTASTRDVTVNYRLAAGLTNHPASSGDYSDSVSGSVNITAGDTTTNIVINIIGDVIDEFDETFTVTLASATNAAVHAVNTVTTVTITDNDDEPTVSVSASTQTCTEGDSGNTICAIPILLSATSEKAITVRYTLNVGTATLTTDYADAGSGTVTIAAGQTTADIRINIVGDTLDEISETFTAAIFAPVHATLGSSRVTTVTITDNDDEPTVSVSASTQTCTEGDSGNTICTIPIRLSAVSSKSITATYRLVAGTATLTDDYADADAGSGTVTIAAGQTAADIRVNIVGDVIDEVHETFTATISSPVNAILGSSRSTVVTITDDDIPEVGFTKDSQSIAEGNSGKKTITLIVKVNTSNYVNDIIVPYTVNSITATPGQDYEVINGNLTFRAGSFVTQQIITLTINGDTEIESDETFSIDLHKSSGAPFELGIAQHTITITNEDR